MLSGVKDVMVVYCCVYDCLTLLSCWAGGGGVRGEGIFDSYVTIP